MKIPIGDGGYIEPDEGPRTSAFHKKIQRATRIPNARGGNTLELECGHRVMTFGNLAHADGVVLCTQCRDQAKAEAN